MLSVAPHMIPSMSNRTPGRIRIQDLWTKRAKNTDGTYTGTRIPAERHGRGLRWRAEIIDDNGEPQTEHFARKDDARKWLEQQSAARVAGTWVDPRLGKTTLASFYQERSSHQVWVPGTRRAMDLAVNSATFGNMAFTDLRPSHVQAWVRAMQDKSYSPAPFTPGSLMCVASFGRQYETDCWRRT